MGLGIALRAFSAGLFNREAAERIQAALDGASVVADEPVKLPEPPKPAPPSKPLRSDAITLLSALQREARLVDLIQENLSAFSDAQVGAAARPCLQQCASSLDRMLGLSPVDESGEGNRVELADSASAARYQWVGEGTGSSETGTAGTLIHKGWQAGRVDLPEWTGDAKDAQIIAPAQIQRV